MTTATSFCMWATGPVRHSIVIHQLLRKILDPPLKELMNIIFVKNEIAFKSVMLMTFTAERFVFHSLRDVSLNI